MISRLYRTSLVLLLVAGLAGCASLKDKWADITDASGLVEYLEGEGLSMMFHGPVSTPEISTPGYEYTVVAGGVLQVYEYKSSGAALLDLSRIEGDDDTSASPHVYRRSKLVVVYTGDDPRTQNLLASALGSRVA